MSAPQSETSAPFSLRIFVADGDPAGLRLVERSNWIGKCVIFPRAVYTNVRSRSEFARTGVYILWRPREDGEGERIYIGEGDPVRPRLESHYANKDFWTHAIFFCRGSRTVRKCTHRHLEAATCCHGSQRCISLDNGNRPAEPTLSEADQADMNVFLQNMLGILPVLGIHAFERSQTPDQRNEYTTLYCQGRGVRATGMTRRKDSLSTPARRPQLTRCPLCNNILHGYRQCVQN